MGPNEKGRASPGATPKTPLPKFSDFFKILTCSSSLPPACDLPLHGLVDGDCKPSFDCNIDSPSSVRSLPASPQPVASPQLFVPRKGVWKSVSDVTAPHSKSATLKELELQESSSAPASPKTSQKLEFVPSSTGSRNLYVSPSYSCSFSGHNWSLKDFSPEVLLHKGYAGVVLKALCLKNREEVVLKCYQFSELDELTKYQVQREASLHAGVLHPNIIGLNVVFQDKDFLVMVLEYAANGDVNKLATKEGGKLDESTTAEKIVVPLLQVLQYLHNRGIVHRDIKPGNILFNKHGTLKLCDFGVAIDLEEECAVTCAGTRSYMAPEVQRCPPKLLPSDNKTRRELHYGCEVDLWSMGVLVYRLLLGELPSDLAKKTVTWLRQYRVLLKAGGSQAQPPKSMTPRPEVPLVFPCAAAISEEAKDFIRVVLCGDPSERPSAAELLQHPWLQRYAVSSFGTRSQLSSTSGLSFEDYGLSGSQGMFSLQSEEHSTSKTKPPTSDPLPTMMRMPLQNVLHVPSGQRLAGRGPLSRSFKGLGGSSKSLGSPGVRSPEAGSDKELRLASLRATRSYADGFLYPKKASGSSESQGLPTVRSSCSPGSRPSLFPEGSDGDLRQRSLLRTVHSYSTDTTLYPASSCPVSPSSPVPRVSRPGKDSPR